MLKALAHDGAFFRRLAYLGARYGPDLLLRSSPLFGIAFALALKEKRQKVRETLFWVNGPIGAIKEERDVYLTFVNYAQCLTEALAGERPRARSARVRVTGEGYLRDTLQSGRGVVVATAHMGPWDAAARLLGSVTDRGVLIAMEGEPDHRAGALHDAVRRRTGVRIVHVGEHPLDGLPLLKQLKAGGIVAVQLDRPARSGRELSVELFGRRVGVPEGPFWLASRSGAPIIPLFVRRRGHFDYEFVINQPIELGASSGPEALRDAAQIATHAMAAFIRESPTQWFNF